MRTRPIPPLTTADVERFWSKVDRSGGPEACWPWKGSHDHYGYGSLGLSGRTVKAHRLAYVLAGALDPNALAVCHRCDNPPCCNPAHLFAASQPANVRDMVSKGRGRPGPGLRAAWATGGHPRGEQHGMARLSRRAALEIRRRRLAGDGAKALAAEFEVCVAHVYRIARGDNWRHVGGAA